MIPPIELSFAAHSRQVTIDYYARLISCLSTAKPVRNNITDAFTNAPADQKSDNNRQSTGELCEVGASAPCGSLF